MKVKIYQVWESTTSYRIVGMQLKVLEILKRR